MFIYLFFALLVSFYYTETFHFCDQAVTVPEWSKDQPRQLKALWLNNKDKFLPLLHRSTSNCIAQRFKFGIMLCS